MGLLLSAEVLDGVPYPDPEDGEALVNLTWKCGHRETFCLGDSGKRVYNIQHRLCWECLNQRIDRQTAVLENTRLMPSDIAE